jgi:transcriptional regulator with XRE-family HTH domain
VSDEYEGVPVGEVIGRNVKRLREERALTQHELAHLWQRRGLNWARSKLSALESGGRPTMSVGELVAIAAAFGVPLSELFQGPPSGRVALSPTGAEVAGPSLAAFFGGAATITTNIGSEAHKKEMARLEAMPERRPAQADIELAQRLGVPARDVVLAAMQAFDSLTLTEERDRRVARMGSSTAPERQAHRGHVTRELAAIVEARLREVGKP